MPGRLFLETPIARIAALAGADPGPVGDEPPRQNIKPGEEIVTLTATGLTRMRWGLIPVGRVNARGRPVMETIVNARSETLFDKSAYAGVGRAVVPADGWYEWTGPRGRKTAWRIAARDGAPLWLAAVTDRWTAPGGQGVDQVATVTCPPNADVRDIHDRMGVLLRSADLPVWLDAPQPVAAALLRTWPDGTLFAEPVAQMD